MGFPPAPPVDFRGKPVASFDPLRDLPSVIGWWDSSTLPGANNSPIAVWPDSGPAFNDLSQSTTAAQPTLTTGGLNGKPTVHFEAASYIARQTFGNGLESGAGFSQPLTLVAVARISSTASRAAAGAITGWVSPASTNRLSLQVDTSGTPSLIGASAGAVGGAPINDDQWHVLIGQFDLLSSSLYVDGFLVAALATQAHGTAVLKGFAIGAAVDGSGPLGTADIAEVGVINTRLSRKLVDQLTRYEATKWGLS